MSNILFELLCDSCGADYEVSYIDETTNSSEPIYCPFCGSDIDITDVVDESLDVDDDFIDELDFDDD